MPVAVVTGSGGLIGSESVAHFVEEGFEVVGIENDMRAEFFGSSASTQDVTERLLRDYPEFHSLELDVRDADGIERLFARHGSAIEVVMHAAAQPSHDWAASAPHVDFEVNAGGTLNLLESTRRHAPDASFIFTSTNKVYGDTPNRLPLVELPTRLELPADHHYFGGIDTSMSMTRPCTRCSGSPRRPPISWCRSTDATSICRRCASEPGASQGPTTPARCCTASSPT